MMELLGRMPLNMALSGKHSKKFFTSQGHMRRISGLNYWPLKKVLMEKYRVKEEEARAFAEFLEPMLAWYPHKRATAQQMLEHPWLNREDKWEYKYTDKEYEIMMLKKELTKAKQDGEEMNELIESDEELNGGDVEGRGRVQEREDREEGDGDGEDSEDSVMELEDSDEERKAVRERKIKEAKINNSFTGPYPLDPTDFNHNDKGPNA